MVQDFLTPPCSKFRPNHKASNLSQKRFVSPGKAEVQCLRRKFKFYITAFAYHDQKMSILLRNG